MTNIHRYPVANSPAFMTVVCHNRAPYLAGDRAKELLLAAMREVKHKFPFAMLGYVVLDDHLHWMIRLVNDTPRGVSAGATRDVSPVEHMTRGANTAMSGSAAHTLTYADGDGAMSGVGQVATNGSYLTPHGGVIEKPDLEKRITAVTPQHTISDIVQSVKLRFTHRYKKEHRISTNTTVWQRRFWDHIIRDQEDFNRHLDYIHYNPVKHGYLPDPADYHWSSFRTYLDRGQYTTGWGTIEKPASLKDMVGNE